MNERIYFYWCDEEGFEFKLSVKAKYAVCSRCLGRGVHDCFEGGFGSDDEFVDYDFIEDYKSGMYDKICEKCNGERVVLVVDRDANSPEHLDRYDSVQREIEETYAIQRAEMAAEEAFARRLGVG